MAGAEFFPVLPLFLWVAAACAAYAGVAVVPRKAQPGKPLQDRLPSKLALLAWLLLAAWLVHAWRGMGAARPPWIDRPAWLVLVAWSAFGAQLVAERGLGSRLAGIYPASLATVALALALPGGTIGPAPPEDPLRGFLGAAACGALTAAGGFALLGAYRRRARDEALLSGFGIVGLGMLVPLAGRGEVHGGFAYVLSISLLGGALSAAIWSVGASPAGGSSRDADSRQDGRRPRRRRFALPVPPALVGAGAPAALSRALFALAWVAVLGVAFGERAPWLGLLACHGGFASVLVSRRAALEPRFPSPERLERARQRWILAGWLLLTAYLLAASIANDATAGDPWAGGPRLAGLFVAWAIYVIDLILLRCEDSSFGRTAGLHGVLTLGALLALWISLFGIGAGN